MNTFYLTKITSLIGAAGLLSFEFEESVFQSDSQKLVYVSWLRKGIEDSNSAEHNTIQICRDKVQHHFFIFPLIITGMFLRRMRPLLKA